MRGFPLLSTVLIIVGFAVAWWPLQHSIKVAEAASNPEIESEISPITPLDGHAEPLTETESNLCEVRIFASAPWQSLRVESLGKVIIENTGADTVQIPDLNLPSDDPQGFDLWIDASFVDDTERVALGIEIENSYGEVIQKTLWSEAGTIADSVFFPADADADAE